jgi:hypothetical protein
MRNVDLPLASCPVTTRRTLQIIVRSPIEQFERAVEYRRGRASISADAAEKR